MNPQLKRDISLIPRGEQYLAIACDSCGGVGSKEMDLVPASPQIVGYYTARVALMEVLSIGALPMALINTLAVEMVPTGQGILEGIAQLLEEAQLPLEMVNGSTEENFPMKQTAMGVTVLGEVHASQLKMGISASGDLVALAGLPKVGHEIQQPFDPEVISLKTLRTLVAHEGVKEVIPVGSKGIHYEAQVLAALNQLEWVPDSEATVDFFRTGGPATSAIFSIAPGAVEALGQALSQPIRIVGRLK